MTQRDLFDSFISGILCGYGTKIIFEQELAVSCPKPVSSLVFLIWFVYNYDNMHFSYQVYVTKINKLKQRTHTVNKVAS